MNNDYEVNLMNKINYLFSKILSLNFKLLKKSKNSNSCFFINDVFDFYISSHAQSFLKSFAFGCIDSKGMCLNARCIIEGLALKTMNENNNMPENAPKLLKYQDYLIEMKQYNKFSEILPEIFTTKDMNINFETSKNMYTKILGEKFSTKKIDKIMKSKIPFLCNPNLGYFDIIEKYLGEEYCSYYSIFSTLIHPNCNLKVDHQFLFTSFIWIIDMLDKNYLTFNCDEELFLNNYLQITITNDTAQAYLNSILTVCNSLKKVKKTIERSYGENFLSDTMDGISILLYEMTLDKLMGFPEQMKCKFKPLIEQIASFYYVFTSDDQLNRYKLSKLHFEIMIKKANKEEFDLSDAYEIYKALCQNGVNNEKFEKEFIKTTGYTINEKGDLLTITSLVNNVIDLIKQDEHGLTYKATSRIDYVESQMLSHANGYMWFANTGAWGDVNNIFQEIFIILANIIEMVKLTYLGDYVTNKNNTLKKIIKVLNQARKALEQGAKEVSEFNKMPQVNLEYQ